MRSLVRPRIVLPHLEKATTGLVNGYSGRDPYEPTFDEENWRRPRILGALHAMHGKACAYCQGQLTPSDRGDVEHFRPKSLYWWLAYVFENYLLSCARCNRVRKGKRFPLAPGEGGLRYGDGRFLLDEQRLLLDPTCDPVDVIRMKLVNATWMLVPMTQEGAPDLRAAKTIEFFELNLGGIPGARQDRIATAIEEAKRIRAGRGDRSYLHRLASRYQPYGVLVRRVLQRSYADLLPGPQDEVRFVIADLRSDLDAYDDALLGKPGHRDTESLREAALWTLAVLWHSPPDGVSPGDVSRWMGNKRRPEVAPLLEMIRSDLADSDRVTAK